MQGCLRVQGCVEHGMVEFLLHDILHAPWLGEANVRSAVREFSHCPISPLSHVPGVCDVRPSKSFSRRNNRGRGRLRLAPLRSLPAGVPVRLVNDIVQIWRLALLKSRALFAGWRAHPERELRESD